jgi:transglutaminase-like putative cysteine protease
MDLHLVPRIDAQQTLRDFKLVVGPTVPVFDYLDWQENRVHHFSVVEPHDRVVIVTNALVEMHPRRWHLDKLDDALPIVKLDHRYQDFLLPHGPVQFDSRLEQFAKATGLSQESGLSKALAFVMTNLATLVTFRRTTPDDACASVAEVLERGEGGAEDCAHVSLSLLRCTGIPARYVSGYRLHHGIAKVETHAWIEAFVPSVGWIGFDPSCGKVVGDTYIALAIGRSHTDVPPLRNVYRGDAKQETTVRVRHQHLQAGRFDESIRVPRIDNRVFVDLMLHDRAISANSLEQQIMM